MVGRCRKSTRCDAGDGQTVAFLAGFFGMPDHCSLDALDLGWQ